MIGGEDRLVRVLNELGPETQNTIFEEMGTSNPDLAAELGKKIVRVEKLKNLDGSSIRRVLRRAGFAAFAMVLKNDSELGKTVLSKMPPGLVERLQHEISAVQDAAPAMLEEQRRKIVSALKTLADEGWIDLSKE